MVWKMEFSDSTVIKCLSCANDTKLNKTIVPVCMSHVFGKDRKADDNSAD